MTKGAHISRVHTAQSTHCEVALVGSFDSHHHRRDPHRLQVLVPAAAAGAGCRCCCGIRHWFAGVGVRVRHLRASCPGVAGCSPRSTHSLPLFLHRTRRAQAISWAAGPPRPSASPLSATGGVCGAAARGGQRPKCACRFTRAPQGTQPEVCQGCGARGAGWLTRLPAPGRPAGDGLELPP